MWNVLILQIIMATVDCPLAVSRKNQQIFFRRYFEGSCQWRTLGGGVLAQTDQPLGGGSRDWWFELCFPSHTLGLISGRNTLDRTLDGAEFNTLWTDEDLYFDYFNWCNWKEWSTQTCKIFISCFTRLFSDALLASVWQFVIMTLCRITFLYVYSAFG